MACCEGRLIILVDACGILASPNLSLVSPKVFGRFEIKRPLGPARMNRNSKHLVLLAKLGAQDLVA